MELLDLREDRAWESVLQCLSENGKLAEFYKVPKHEMKALVRLYGRDAVADLGRVFSMTSRGRYDERQAFVREMSQERIYCMLHYLVRSMKCWVETESPVQTVRLRWKIANA